MNGVIPIPNPYVPLGQKLGREDATHGAHTAPSGARHWDSPIGGAVLSLTGHRDVPAQQFPYQAFIPDGML